MSDRLPAGPYEIITSTGELSIPYYVLPFDRKGRCEAPETLRHLLEGSGGHSDIFFFSHGWNNDWAKSTGRYRSFINGFLNLREELNLSVPAKYRPLLVGIFWPSTSLVRDSEQAPCLASTTMDDEAVAAERQTIREIADGLPDERVPRVYELLQRERLDAVEARELAERLQPFYRPDPSEPGPALPPSPDEIMKIWQSLALSDREQLLDLDEAGTVAAPGSANWPQAAGPTGDFFKSILPRDILRTFTVWQMKDRAGVVGANGVSELLQGLLTRSAARLHLVGHSYGSKVVLSALCAPFLLPRKVYSLLLLQPAISHLCFATQVPGTKPPRTGGYRKALERVERPILSTFSANDEPLTKTFHLALRRDNDLAEARIAAAGEPPSVYAALGGFGPREAGEAIVDVLDAPQRYTLEGSGRVIGVNGTRTIRGHGDVSNRSTWWMLHNLVKARA